MHLKKMEILNLITNDKNVDIAINSTVTESHLTKKILDSSKIYGCKVYMTGKPWDWD